MKIARAHHKAPASPTRHVAVVVLAAAGFVIAAYLTATRLSGAGAVFCTKGGSCDLVQASHWAVLLGVPTAAWGAVLYALVGGLALAGLTARRWRVAFVLASVAVGVSAFLTGIEVFVLHALCAYCLASAAISVAILATLLTRRPAVTPQRTWARPRPLAALGATSAVVAVLLMAGAFFAEGPTGDPAYQKALARHLAGSGAVMYGAFW